MNLIILILFNEYICWFKSNNQWRIGNDTLNIVNQLEGSSISLEIDMENVNLMNSDSTNKSVHVNSLGFGGTTSNIDSTGFDYNVSEYLILI